MQVEVANVENKPRKAGHIARLDRQVAQKRNLAGHDHGQEAGMAYRPENSRFYCF
jgi:hypothetical protein